ncbi:hypothetical protein [Amycolatopsis sp. cmx-4-68]|uniref:hypothetical protein n=1 Tax=Amycolatopsis sp. cmx-4-68 TaxID=2790938 RepID=UPI00397A7B55
MLDNGIPVRITAAPREPGVHRRYAAYYAMSASIMLLAAAIWLSTELRPSTAWHDVALFAHLASLVLGLGAVLVADYFFVLWVFGRVSFAEAVRSASRLHLLVWGGLTGLVASGALLEPDLGSAATVVKLCLVGVLAVNGVHATVLGGRLALAGDAVPFRLLARGAVTTAISQLCWWGAVVIGFLNATR